MNRQMHKQKNKQTKKAYSKMWITKLNGFELNMHIYDKTLFWYSTLDILLTIINSTTTCLLVFRGLLDIILCLHNWVWVIM